MDAKITIFLPSRSRPEAFFKSLDNIISNCESDEFEIISIHDYDDLLMNNEAVRLRLSSYKKVSSSWGFSTGKVNAVNGLVGQENGSIIILHSDDFFITKFGFDNDIREAADGFAGLIHFPDQFQNKNLCTYPVLTKNYLDIDGFIYHYKFTSVYCDDFQTLLAKKRRMYKFVDKKIIEHRHWRNGLAEKDELYLRNDNEQMYEKDRKVYEELKKEYEL